MAIQTFRKKAGDAFEVVKFTGSQASAKEVCNWIVEHGGSAVHRPAQVPLFNAETERMIEGFSNAILIDATRYDPAQMRTEMLILEVGEYVMFDTPDPTYGPQSEFRIATQKWFDETYEEV